MGLFKEKMKDPVQGRAEVIESSGTLPGSGRPQLRLIVTADGVSPTPVSYQGKLSDKKARVPDIGDSIPVTVDRANPQNISIEWSELPTREARNRQQTDQLEQERLAEMRGEGGEGQEGQQSEQESQRRLQRSQQFEQESKRLSERRKSGAVTEAEFQQQKRRILDELQDIF